MLSWCIHWWCGTGLDWVFSSVCLLGQLPGTNFYSHQRQQEAKWTPEPSAVSPRSEPLREVTCYRTCYTPAFSYSTKCQWDFTWYIWKIPTEKQQSHLFYKSGESRQVRCSSLGRCPPVMSKCRWDSLDLMWLAQSWGKCPTRTCSNHQEALHHLLAPEQSWSPRTPRLPLKSRRMLRFIFTHGFSNHSGYCCISHNIAFVLLGKPELTICWFIWEITCILCTLEFISISSVTKHITEFQNKSIMMLRVQSRNNLSYAVKVGQSGIKLNTFQKGFFTAMW